MKNPSKLLGSVILILCLSLCMISCTQEEGTEKSETTADNGTEWVELRESCNGFFYSHDSLDLIPLQEYLNSVSCGFTRSGGDDTESFVQFDTLELHNFCNRYSLRNDNEFYSFLYDHSEMIQELVTRTCSPAFSHYFEEASKLYSEEMEENYFKSVYQSDDMCDTEKALLILIGSSENLHVPQTRSVSSCIKRYAKLTVIVLKTLYISRADIQSGNDYAVRELKNMGEEYDC